MGSLCHWGPLSKNRYEHIHVRFSQAIHGLRNFWKVVPNDTDLTLLMPPRSAR